MVFLPSSALFYFVAVVFSLGSWSWGNAATGWRRPPSFSKTIVVSPSGKGHFSKIQDAIDRGVPQNNAQWIHICIQPGIYNEQIKIPRNKPYIALEGGGSANTSVQHSGTVEYRRGIRTWAATITVESDNFVAKGITFKNTYNRIFMPPWFDNNGNPRTVAIAASIQGDKNAFYRCGFVGLQDTLLDGTGRHYFNKCYIEGFVDFIFGNGQSIYQYTTISVIPMLVAQGTHGYITAQHRSAANETTGFVFKDCKVVGSGQTYLGRAWGPYSRVLFFNTQFSNIVVPEGWSAWKYDGHEDKITYAEVNCTGPGSNTSKRVYWEKKISSMEINNYTSENYINADKWIENQPLTNL